MDLLEPGLDVVEGGRGVEVVEEDDADSVFVISACDGAKRLLSGLG